MGYVTQADLEERFGVDEVLQLTDPTNVGVVNQSILARAISDASAVVDGYLRSAYSLPLASVPPELGRITGDLARYYLYNDRATQRVIDLRNEAVQWLRDVAAGRASLGVAMGEVTPPSAVGGARVSSAPRVFTPTTLAHFK
jgi:phage gp36-like protein